MEEFKIQIPVPDGYEIDTEKSTFETIVFKKKEEKRWRDDENAISDGYHINTYANIVEVLQYKNTKENYSIFATAKQARSALAMARISQIMANDKRFGGPVTDEEWKNANISKACICRHGNTTFRTTYCEYYEFLAFHTSEQRDLFFNENIDLVKDYLML